MWIKWLSGQKISICQKNSNPIFFFQYMIFWTHKIFLAMTKIFFEYHVGVKNAKNRRNLCPAISQQPIIRFSQDFACNTSFTWAKRHEASFGSDCCLPDRISKRRYILRPNIQILVIFSMHLKVIHFD